MMSMKLLNIRIDTDGSCYNCPPHNTMGSAAVLHIEGGIHDCITLSPGLGTNNEAEWYGLVIGFDLLLEYLKKREEPNATYKVVFCCDNEVVVKQYNGEYRLGKFQRFLDVVKDLERQVFKFKINSIKVKWIPREQNFAADTLSKEANPYYSKQRVKKGK